METAHGDVARVIAIDNQSLTAEASQAELERLNTLTNHSEIQEHRHQREQKDADRGGPPSCSRFGYNVREVTMRQISLREFRTRGSKALEAVPQGETILLSGQQGPAYFLVPVLGDVVMEDRELRRAMAKASLRESWVHARASGLDEMADEEIEQEIKQVRGLRKRRKTR